jgi:hypothetical protein
MACNGHCTQYLVLAIIAEPDWMATIVASLARDDFVPTTLSG